jgi:hypothetical protein
VRLLSCLLFGAALLGGRAAARAHPVAQGAMRITATPEGVQIHAQVSNEEAYVAATFSRNRASDTLPEIYRTHGEYLLNHLRVIADGRLLSGRVVKIEAPANTVPGSFIGYELRFPFGGRPPAKIRFEENVLNEFTFAPGNPWEATYVVRLAQFGQPAREGLLFSRHAPLALACDWNAPPVANPAGSVDRLAMAKAFVWHGILHILTGYDHLLFVSSLVLGAITIGDLIKVVTAFTVAHTLTLTLAVLDLFRLPSSIVEPMIAASIVFVGAQNVFAPRASRGWTRLGVAFGFGLFHGLGFAGGLLAAMAGMAGTAVAIAIAAFSLGVELGHQLISIPLFTSLWLVRRASARKPDPERIPRRVTRLASGAIALAGLVYLVAALRSP